MSPATRRRFLEIELNRGINHCTQIHNVFSLMSTDERESNLLTPTLHGSMDDLSRSSSACLLDGPEVSIREDSVNTYYDLLPDELGRYIHLSTQSVSFYIHTEVLIIVCYQFYICFLLFV